MKTSNPALRLFLVLIAASLIISSCAPPSTTPSSPLIRTDTQPPALAATNTPALIVTDPPAPLATATAAAPAAVTATPTFTPTPIPFQPLTLKPGDFYFSADGQGSFLFSRNLTGKTQEDFDTLLEWSRQSGTQLIRVHLTHGWWGDAWIQQDWTVNEKWARDWDGFFDRAQAAGISVIPVFGVWADWNTGKPDFGSPLWMYNPLNPANGGPLEKPQELFQPGSAAQKAWLKWVAVLVERWQARDNIAAWEIFSEINIASGPTGHSDANGGLDEPTGVDFTTKAAAVIRAADSKHRPVTLSSAGVYAQTDKWAEYYHLKTLDFIEIHPYSDRLDRQLITDVRSMLETYQKPVMIGESGLWSMTDNAHSSRGITHAIWAGMVSGALNGRSLWMNDGYDLYSHDDRAAAMQFLQEYASIEQPAGAFAWEVDFRGYQPLQSTTSPDVGGAALGSEHSAIGWYRDAASEPPFWDLKDTLSKQSVTIWVPGAAPKWQVNFYDTRTGTPLHNSITVSRQGKVVTVPLPDFQDSIAFKMLAVK